MARKKKPSGQAAKLQTAKHGEPGYDPMKDPWNVGFQYGQQPYKYGLEKVGKKVGDEIDAYDFYADLETGLRPGETKLPSGASIVDLTRGVSVSTILPPLQVWKEGSYVFDFVKDNSEALKDLPYSIEKLFEKDDVKDGLKEANAKVPQEVFAYYVVDGEGTPGNFIYRVYELPNEIAKQAIPKHPLMWPEAIRKPYKTTYTGSEYSGGYGGVLGGSKPATASKSSSPSLPAGVRMRCTGCGHWFKMDNLSGHAQVCPGTSEDGETDWAMMCADECGCTTLDQVSKCKPGFPRSKQEPKEEQKDPDEPSPSGSPAPHDQLVTPTA